jgi:hypothetical protein
VWDRISDKTLLATPLGMDKLATMASKIHVPFEIDPKSIIRTTLEILSGKYYMAFEDINKKIQEEAGQQWQKHGYVGGYFNISNVALSRGRKRLTINQL